MLTKNRVKSVKVGNISQSNSEPQGLGRYGIAFSSKSIEKQVLIGFQQAMVPEQPTVVKLDLREPIDY